MSDECVIDKHTRQRIERKRLMRIVRSRARAPTALEMERLRDVLRKIEHRLPPAQHFVGMQAVGMTHANRGDLDVNGYGSLKADGVHAHLVRVTSRAMEEARQKVADEADEQAEIEVPRCDTVLCVLRNNTVLALDRVVLLKPDVRVVLDGELCLRKEHLSPEERYRINSAVSVHTGDYLDFFTAADEEAAGRGVDVRSDAHQEQYDKYYTLLFGAFDALYAGARVTGNPYLERMKLVKELTEVPLARMASKMTRQAVEELEAQVERAGGISSLALFVFCKPIWSVQFIKAALHTVPECMRGVLIDGVIFNPAQAPYTRGINRQLLKFKLAHPIDFEIAASPGAVAGELRYALRVMQSGRLLELEGGELLADTRLAIDMLDELFGHCKRGGRAHSAIVECEPVVDVQKSVRWRPLQHRAEKRFPNNYETYTATLESLNNTFDETALIKYVQQRLRTIRQRGASGATV